MTKPKRTVREAAHMALVRPHEKFIARSGGKECEFTNGYTWGFVDGYEAGYRAGRRKRSNDA